MADGGFCRGTAAGTRCVPHMGSQLHAWEPLGAASRASPAQDCPRRAPLPAPTPPPLCTGTRAASSSWPCGARRTAARRAAPSSAAQRGCWRRAAPRCRLWPRARARVQGWHGGTRTVEDSGTRRAAPAPAPRSPPRLSKGSHGGSCCSEGQLVAALAPAGRRPPAGALGRRRAPHHLMLLSNPNIEVEIARLGTRVSWVSVCWYLDWDNDLNTPVSETLSGYSAPAP